MKNLYVNSHLYPLLLKVTRDEPRTWIFSQGEPWLLLTPVRLERLAALLGLYDRRIDRLVKLARRHAPDSDVFGRRLGLKFEKQLKPAEYPAVACPECDCIHFPHPEDAHRPCPPCGDRECRQPAGVLRDRNEDMAARRAIARKDPHAFEGDRLSPNWRINFSRRLRRDWDSAVNRILMGCAYRDVAREYECSVGLLHRKVQEQRQCWDNN